MSPLALCGVAFLAVFSSLALFAYNTFQDQVRGAPVPPRWPNRTITWSLNTTIGTNVDIQDAAKIGDVLATAFNAWSGAQGLNNLAVARGPDSTLIDPDTRDCKNVVSFTPSDAVTAKFSTGAVAFTEVATAFDPNQTSPPFTFRVCGKDITTSLPAILIDADIVFNPKQQFSTTTPPTTGRADVQSVATHEFGHAAGLDHSGIAHAMLYPFGDVCPPRGQECVLGRNLAVDDVMGVAFLYPAPNFSATGTISGRITLSGSGIYASHVVAVDAVTGAAVIDGLTSPDGTYRLVGVPPGTYNVLALPLAPDLNSGLYTLDNFAGWTCGYGENSPPCCDPKTEPVTCKPESRIVNPTNYTGKFF